MTRAGTLKLFHLFIILELKLFYDIPTVFFVGSVVKKLCPSLTQKITALLGVPIDMVRIWPRNYCCFLQYSCTAYLVLGKNDISVGPRWGRTLCMRTFGFPQDFHRISVGVRLWTLPNASPLITWSRDANRSQRTPNVYKSSPTEERRCSHR